MDKKTSLQELANQEAARRGGSQEIDAQHKAGKLTAFERVETLLDKSSFVELDRFLVRTEATPGYECATATGEGVITGFGTIDGRPVYVFAQDYTVLAGSMSMAQAGKIVKIMDMAARNGSPLIGILDSGGARITQGAAAMGAYSSVIKKLNELSGVVPTFSVLAGPCIGASASLACLTDYTIAIDRISTLLLHAPQILASGAGADFDSQKAGGATAQNEITGVAQFLAADETAAYSTVRRLLSFMPQNNLEDAPVVTTSDDLNRLISELDTQETVDAKELIFKIADSHDFLEVYAGYATGMVTGFIRLNGSTVGVVANRMQSLNAQSARKATRFITLLDAYHLPILTLADCADIPPQAEIADENLITALSGLLFAYAQASVPMVTVVTGSAVGAGLLAMGPKSAGADIVYAWSSALVSAMPPEAGALIVFDDEIKAANDPITARQEAIKKYKSVTANAFTAAKQGIVDDVIAPSATRQMVIAAFEACAVKRDRIQPPKKHGILPL